MADDQNIGKMNFAEVKKLTQSKNTIPITVILLFAIFFYNP
jgi:hypothetical protein